MKGETFDPDTHRYAAGTGSAGGTKIIIPKMAVSMSDKGFVLLRPDCVGYELFHAGGFLGKIGTGIEGCVKNGGAHAGISCSNGTHLNYIKFFCSWGMPLAKRRKNGYIKDYHSCNLYSEGDGICH
jgi:hypothetical protein